jgi:membrane-associated phospholipid phosphatase
MRYPLLGLSAVTVALVACADTNTEPSPPVGGLNNRAAQFWESGASVYWNQVARDLVVKSKFNAFQAIRGYAALSVAQYNGIVAAENATGVPASPRAAAIGASVVVLSYLFPAEATALEDLVEQQLASPVWSGESQTDLAAGEAAGRAAAALVVAHAQADKFFAPWSGTVPTGPGLWFSSASPPAPPVGVLFGQATPYFLTSGDQFRPPPPLAFGSPEFNAALAEVRQISDTRTAEQDASAKFWAFPVGTYAPSGYWNEEAARLIMQNHRKEREAAHTLALMNMAGFDAIIATHDAKYTYWSIRPSQADPAIVLAIGLPNFPSYPSNHASLSAAMTDVLGAAFPAEKSRLSGLVQEAALSRLYGGIHYRFDCDTGVELGHKVAAWALAHDVAGREAFELE